MEINEPKQVLTRLFIILRDKYDGNVSAFARALHMSQVTLNNYIIGKRALSLNAILAVLDNDPELSAEWLLRGRGSYSGKHGLVANIINSVNSCGQADVFNCSDSVHSDYQEQIAEYKRRIQDLESQRDKLLNIIEKLSTRTQ